jgi:uncharacterized NAD(P)/FAD-binding protein YdhS
MTRRIAIVGGGLSGTLTAVHLMRRALHDDLHITLVNRSGLLARGVAYGTRSDAHVLNVPAGRMSAFDDDEGHFLRFAQREDAALHAGSFVRRERYGKYLEWTLRSAQAALPEPGRFVHLVGQVHDLQEAGPVGTLRVGDARHWEVDRIVLALGNFAPANPGLADGCFFECSLRYVRDPWTHGALDRIDPARPVLLIGTGLTMVDVALALHARGHSATLHALSRRGLLPHVHRGHASAAGAVALPAALLSGQPLLRRWLRTLRAQCRAHEAQGIDWRDTLAALRATTPAMWERLDAAQRAQFLRHLQPYWDVHRHRLAPQPAARLQALRAAGGLMTHAGHLVAIDEDSDSAEVSFRPRCSMLLRTLRVGSVVNCTGPSTQVPQAQEPLMRALLARGLLQPDPLRLGIAVAEDHAVLRADGRPSQVLHYIGPMLRARYWECTAVPELRGHAQRLAATLCG